MSAAKFPTLEMFSKLQTYIIWSQLGSQTLTPATSCLDHSSPIFKFRTFYVRTIFTAPCCHLLCRALPSMPHRDLSNHTTTSVVCPNLLHIDCYHCKLFSRQNAPFLFRSLCSLIFCCLNSKVRTFDH